MRPPDSFSAFRTTWPSGDLLGQFAITNAALDALDRLLPTYRGADGPHEGIAFLCGLELPNLTLYTTVIAPDADHGQGHVRCSDTHLTAVSAAARQQGLGLLAQVHTHPSGATGHSWGDDTMIFMPFEGMLSIVMPDYGRYRVRPLHSLGVHQFQRGTWVLCNPASVKTNFTVIADAVDLR